MYLTQQFFMSIVPNARWYGPDFPENINLVVDSRALKPGDFFAALKGNQRDGHDFILDVLHAGASGVIATRYNSAVEEFIIKEGKTYIIVHDVMHAITSVAKAWRAQMSITVVGITGSVGKTSTKQLIAEILKAAEKNALVSQGNQNTALGISLTLWRLHKKHEIAVFEMGISKKGEMVRMADIVRPTYGVITYIGHSHSEGLGSSLDVAAEKRAIFSFFDDCSIGIIQGDQRELSALSYRHPIVRFGKKMTHQVQVRKVVVHNDHISCLLKMYHEKFPVTIPTSHLGFLNCVMAATAVAYLLGICHKIIVEVIQRPLVIPGRYEKKQLPGNSGLIINDAYNASPESMKSALLAFESMQAARKIAVLGDMLELGELTPFWHRQIGRFLKKVPSLSHLILVGSHVAHIKKTAPLGLSCILVSTWQEAVAAVRPYLGADTALLVKASRGIALNNLVDDLEKNS